jgi:hypothetical protein
VPDEAGIFNQISTVETIGGKKRKYPFIDECKCTDKFSLRNQKGLTMDKFITTEKFVARLLILGVFSLVSSAHALTFNITYDSSVTSQANAAQITNAFGIATQTIQTLYTNSSSVNIFVYFSSSVGLGASQTSFVGSGGFLYPQLTNVLRSARTTAADSNSVASLPASDPTGGAWYLARAEAKALELSSLTFSNLFQINPNDTNQDGTIGFASTVSYNFDSTNRAAVFTNYDFIGVAEHEITEVMGRSTLGLAGNYVPYDLFRFTNSGARSFNPNATNVYFSINNGVTSLKSFNPAGNGGDIQDWATSTPPDSYDAFISNSQIGKLSSADLTAVDIIGYNLNFTAPRLTGATLANGNFKINFTNVTGMNFVVLATTNISLSISNWTNLGTPTESPAGQYQFTDTQANKARFYRVSLP